MLKFNKTITPRTIGTSKGDAVSYGYLEGRSRYDTEKGTLVSNIQKIRWWWRYLRVAVECEERDILVGDETISTDKIFYKDWDLEKINFGSFDDWFKDHRELFTEPPVSLSKPSNDEEHITLYIPKNRFTTDVMREIRPLLDETLTGRKLKFQLSGRKLPLVQLHMRYNVFVMFSNGKSRREIMEWVNEKYLPIETAIQYNRKKVYVKTKETEGLEDIDYGDRDTPVVISMEQSVSRHLRKSRQQIIDVAAGIFP